MNIKHHYDYTSNFVNETQRSTLDRNQPIYEQLEELATQAGCKLTVTHFISKHSRSPQCLYEDIEIQQCPDSIRQAVDAVLASRYLTPLSVNANKGFVDIDEIKQDLFALSR